MKTKILILLTGILLLSSFFGCSKGTRRSDPKLLSQNQSPIAEVYKLGYGDVLDVRFFSNRQYNVVVPVRPDGRITIEQIGDVEVDGKSPAYVDSVITAEFSKFLREPKVTVIVTEFGNNHVYVLGEVESPGRYDIAKGMTMIQAIATAGGAKEDAQMSDVLLIRPDQTTEPQVTMIDLGSLSQKSGDARVALNVQPLDVILVPNTKISDISRFMQHFYDSFIPPVDTYLRALFWSRLN